MVKNLPASAEDAREAASIPGLGRSPGGGNGNPLQYSFFVFNFICISFFLSFFFFLTPKRFVLGNSRLTVL